MKHVMPYCYEAEEVLADSGKTSLIISSSCSDQLAERRALSCT